MAKKIKNPVEVKVVKTDGVFDVSAHFGIACDDCGQETRKGIPITLRPETLADIDEEAIAQIHAHEGTTEVE